ncbi:Ig-like domain-containing protein [Anaerocolumna sp.]|uniref:Ig-like domain-containing protein n=1 Tax=Anaerocolumna sp. TaxID=2041569 RepID=UPI0028A82CAC|nr:Ig-like domain-containing protein [Anaerocolumna sp.]
MKKFKGKILLGVMCMAAAISISMLPGVKASATTVPTPTPTPVEEEYYFDYGGKKIPHGGSITISDGNSIDLRVSATDATSVNWKSSEESVAKAETGTPNYQVKVTPKGPGFSEISATVTKDGVTKTVVCYIEVPLVVDNGNFITTSSGDKVLQLTFNPDASDPDSTKTINIMKPDAGTTPNLLWTVANPEVAVVDSTGKVTAKGAGSTIITITSGTSLANGKKLEAKVPVIVSPLIKDTDNNYKSSATILLAEGITSTTLNTNAGSATNLAWEIYDNKGTIISASDTGRIIRDIHSYDSKINLYNLKAGTYKIKAYSDIKYKGDGKITPLEITLIVPIHIKDGREYIIMNVGDDFRLTDNSNIYNPGIFTYTYPNGDSTAVSVAPSTGIIKAEHEGSVEVLLTYQTSSGLFDPAYTPSTKTIRITVIDGISLNHTNAIIYKSGSIQLIATSTENTNTTLWTTSDPAVATVEDGLVTGIKKGTVTITASQIIKGVRKTATCIIRVEDSVSKVTVSPASTILEVDQFVTLSAKVEPAGANKGPLHWVSSDPNVVEVKDSTDLAATIRGVHPGTAVISAINQDNVVVGYCHVSVRQHVERITLSETAITLPLTTKNFQLRANVEPENATNKNVKWKSTNESVARVDEKGMVTLVSSGVAAVIAFSESDPSVTAICNITVEIPVRSLTLDEKAKVMYVGESARIGYLLTPNDASKKNVVWSSTDTSVVSVDSKGLITARGAGQAIVMVKTEDGAYYSTCTITVRQKATGIKFDVDNLELNVGQTYTIELTVTPSNSTELGLVWDTTDSKVATVDEKGKITAKAPGKAVIFVRTAYGAAIYCNVTVVQQPNDLQLNFDEKTLVIGEEFKLKATMQPSSAEEVNLTWTSSNEKVAKVSNNGTVKAISGGTAVIKVQTADKKITKFCVVNVVEPVTNIKLNKTSYVMGVGKRFTLKATVEANTATNPKVKWSTSNSKVATVDSKGVVTAKSLGTVVITVTAQDGTRAEASCDIRVVRAVTSVTLNTSAVTTVEGRSFTLKATVKPNNATIKKVKWTSSDESVAIVDSKGVVTALKAGTATIKASATDNSGKYASAVVKVKAQVPASKVIVSTKSLIMTPGESATLQKVINPTNSTDRFTWETDNKTVASVDKSTGRVTAHKPGTANVIVITESGKTATTEVTVVGLNTTNLELEQYSRYTLSVIGVNSGIVWDVDDPGVATVRNGIVESRKVGTTTITANINGKILRCRIKVTPIG